ncbi:GNAT family N-acetyltransferase [Sphingomonas sp. ABOLH]|uniref:GNAT family N-acetyltransferase n=1 Tax=Sphingomonas sp. ABOLH TaxID=1985881 RepID=UPI000F7E51D4|nr:GNAT family N-acetyltransferase [Sphingomonas sp. ABOLH]RSV24365.1 N-acetyltransferase [Sphingomonas sp. ABOLH]
MIVRPGGLDHPGTARLLAAHLADMHASSPPGSVYALDLSALATPDIAFYTAWDGDTLLGCGALRTLGDGTGEIKSMRTDATARGRSVGQAVLDRIIADARMGGLTRLLLETGTGAMFDAAHRLYARGGFAPCPPFGSYVATDFNRFLSRTL